jgi:hypothetical protein
MVAAQQPGEKLGPEQLREPLARIRLPREEPRELRELPGRRPFDPLAVQLHPLRLRPPGQPAVRKEVHEALEGGRVPVQPPAPRVRPIGLRRRVHAVADGSCGYVRPQGVAHSAPYPVPDLLRGELLVQHAQVHLQALDQQLRRPERDLVEAPLQAGGDHLAQQVGRAPFPSLREAERRRGNLECLLLDQMAHAPPGFGIHVV